MDVAVGEKPPIEFGAAADVLSVAPDRSRAVLHQCVVPLQKYGEAIYLLQIIDQQGARIRRGNAQAIQIDLLAAVVGSQPDQVAFIGDHIVELVLAEEPSNRGI